MKNNMFPIDFVVTWVDGSDPKWLQERAKYSNPSCGNSEVRFRDFGMLRYWFRSIEVNAPWVRRIYFVTFGHIPDWLDVDNPKLQIVNHREIIDNRLLPTFNSCAIEVNLHKIPGLSEHFVYFNDDMFLNSTVMPETFFKNGRPMNSYVFTDMNTCDQANSIRKNCNEVAKKYRRFTLYPYSLKNGLLLSGRNFLYSIRRNIGFSSKHAPAAYLKETFSKLWECEGDVLGLTSSHRFRSDNDCSQWIFEYYQLYTGISVPRKYYRSKHYSLSIDTEAICEEIESQKHSMICINDTAGDIEDINLNARKIISAFNSRYPKKSSFERGDK